MTTLSINADGSKEVRRESTARQLYLNCRACATSGSMYATNIYRFSMILRIIGLMFIVPSVGGMIMAGISLLSSFITMASLATSGPPGRNDAAAIGAALGLTMGFGIAIAMAAGSLLYGTIGLIFWMRREVWKCDKCGSFIDRSKP